MGYFARLAVDYVGAVAAVFENRFNHTVVIKRVAGVHEVDIRACGSRNALVHCVVNAFVRLGDPIGKPVGVLFYDVDSAVGRAAVNDDVFDIRIALTEHRQHGLLYAVCRIITDGYNRYFKHLEYVIFVFQQFCTARFPLSGLRVVRMK